jgi:hypothetical protein
MNRAKKIQERRSKIQDPQKIQLPSSNSRIPGFRIGEVFAASPHPRPLTASALIWILFLGSSLDLGSLILDLPLYV